MKELRNQKDSLQSDIDFCQSSSVQSGGTTGYNPTLHHLLLQKPKMFLAMGKPTQNDETQCLVHMSCTLCITV